MDYDREFGHDDRPRHSARFPPPERSPRPAVRREPPPAREPTRHAHGQPNTHRQPPARRQPPPRPSTDLPDSRDQQTLVRPYVLTKGRTRSTRHLAIEALISARSDAPRWRSTEITGEFRSVGSLCRHPRSVAEVAATLSVPLGVARVLLCDMADLGLVSVHESEVTGDGRPGRALLERVLKGLRRL